MGLNERVPANAEDAFLAWTLALPPGADARAAARLALIALPSTGGPDLTRLRLYIELAARTGAATPQGRRRRRRPS